MTETTEKCDALAMTITDPEGNVIAETTVILRDSDNRNVRSIRISLRWIPPKPMYRRVSGVKLKDTPALTEVPVSEGSIYFNPD